MSHPTHDGGDADGRGPRWAMVCAGTALIGACYGFARFSYGLFTPQFQAEFTLGPALTGIVGSGSYIGYSVAIVISLLLTARIGAKPLAIAAGGVATVGTAMVAVAPNASVLAAGILVAGSSTGLASPPLAAAVARWVVLAARDRAQAVVNAGTGVGVLLSGPVALLLAEDWRAAWGTFSVLCAAVTVWISVVVPVTPPGPAGAAGSGDRAVAAGTTRLLLAALLMGLASSAVWTFGRDVITTVGGAGPTESAVMWIVIGASGLVGAASSDLTARIGLARAWSFVLVVLSTATMLLAVSPDITAVVMAAAALFGASYIALCGLLLLWSTRLYPDRPSTGVGASFLMIAVGQALGAPLVGAIIGDAGYHVAFAAVALLGLVGATVRSRHPAAHSHAGQEVVIRPPVHIQKTN